MSEHNRYMDMALRLAARAQGRTRPNPTVGCVLVKQGRIVGKGYHHRAGLPHAEREALAEAGAAARGATAYVTLEPCSHHGRTPPCCDGLIEAGVAQVVAAMSDPNPQVAGRGLERLRAAGIAVTVGVREAEAQALIRPFTTWMLHKRPMVTLKAAASLDGKTATRSGQSQWITGPAARKRGHQLRNSHDAILIGSGTLLADDPQLTCRLRGGRDPVRVVVDANLRIADEAAVLNLPSQAPTWIIATEQADPIRRAELSARNNVEVITCGALPDGRVDLHDLMGQLASRDITSVLSEAGGILTSALLEARLADRVALFLAPMLIGGGEARGILGGLGVSELAQAPRIERMALQSLDGGDLYVSGDLIYEAPES
ncbi:bifunctional diaminohydroxyphosphoribosylaminopyrimidine deaminase/5-amino-6-(5-phosphoribosylamino)uracil reductase RibD [Magnetofaba australis]|uniref:Riboflavin biosynthesis protein RibD n=1 Tax=Magnetofaba australis IT-1 TaxID=1434232 RepID=A0A1Y2K0K1_9PROT|nr:bifunctional diaminohydroxyphosphoribosylaminopyrimidine deaminase/5-amino-6-(5-phosphoribosylamino)uracil reductase RibD [Magnetofaba australis]OSM00273.1 putative diaminohydroxyphosphoribosylaminopyrimidine deaminase [Magnetofaba australis IT-1]